MAWMELGCAKFLTDAVIHRASRTPEEHNRENDELFSRARSPAHWSFVVYDNQTRSMLQTDQQFPSIGSQKESIQKNADGSVDVYVGPTAPAGKESTWIQTVPGKSWNTILRLYGPLEAWFKAWRPGEIELVQ